jgi:hypothetical protein
MDQEMAESLSALRFVAVLKAFLPDVVHGLKGNHENIANEEAGGNLPFGKFVYEGAMVAEYMERFYSPQAHEAVYRFEKSLPLLAVGGRHIVGHAEPARCFPEHEVVDYRRRPDVVLGLAGEGPESAAIEAQARDLGVADRVKLLGYRRDVPTLLRASFALALPSEREGLPRSLMEASCMERPVLATRIRGVTELVHDGVTGFLHDVGDVPALAEAIRRLVDAPERAAAMGHAGRAAMRRFDLATVLEGHDGVYRSLLGERFV